MIWDSAEKAKNGAKNCPEKYFVLKILFMGQNSLNMINKSDKIQILILQLKDRDIFSPRCPLMENIYL